MPPCLMPKRATAAHAYFPAWIEQATSQAAGPWAELCLVGCGVTNVHLIAAAARVAVDMFGRLLSTVPVPILRHRQH